jgi:hypothetical protein
MVCLPPCWDVMRIPTDCANLLPRSGCCHAKWSEEWRLADLSRAHGQPDTAQLNWQATPFTV